MTATGLEPTTTLPVNEHSTILAKWLSVRLRISGCGFESSYSQSMRLLLILKARSSHWNKNIKYLFFFPRRAFYSNMLLGKYFKRTNLKNIFFKNCLFGWFRTVDEAKKKKKINHIVKLPIMMKLLITSTDNKSSEYCFNKKLFFYHSSQDAEHVLTQSAVDNTMSTQVRKQNQKNVLKNQNRKKNITKKMNDLLQQLSLLFFKFLYFLFNHFLAVFCFCTFFL